MLSDWGSVLPTRLKPLMVVMLSNCLQLVVTTFLCYPTLFILFDSLAPAVVTLPKSVGAKEDPEDSAKSTVAIDPTDCEPIPATQFRFVCNNFLV